MPNFLAWFSREQLATGIVSSLIATVIWIVVSKVWPQGPSVLDFTAYAILVATLVTLASLRRQVFQALQRIEDLASTPAVPSGPDRVDWVPRLQKLLRAHRDQGFMVRSLEHRGLDTSSLGPRVLSYENWKRYLGDLIASAYGPSTRDRVLASTDANAFLPSDGLTATLTTFGPFVPELGLQESGSAQSGQKRTRSPLDQQLENLERLIDDVPNRELLDTFRFEDWET